MENRIYCLFTFLFMAFAQEQDTREAAGPGCKCESILVLECCRNTDFSALLDSTENVALLDELSKPFYIVSPSLNRRRISIVTPDLKITLLNITVIRRNESPMTATCVSSGCEVKLNSSRLKDANCQYTICNGSVIDASFETDSRTARLTRLKCVGRICGNVLFFDEPPELAEDTNTEEETEPEPETEPETKATSMVTVQAGVMDTIWLVVLLGGTTVGVLAVIGVVFACLTRRDRRRKAMSAPSSAASNNWHFRPTPTFVAAVDEFYRAAMTPDAEDDAASASDEYEDDEVMERSSAQRTIKFSAAPTFAPTPSRLNVSGETLEARHTLVSSTNATPVAPVKSILKKNSRSLSHPNRNRTDAAVDTAHPQTSFLFLTNPTLANNVGHLGLPSTIGTADPAANESACVSSSSSSYSLVECADKAVGVTESELDSNCTSAPTARAELDGGQLAHLFVTPSGQLVQLVPASPSPSTNLSPASTSNLPDPNLLAPQPGSASVSASVSVCESSECDCECESQSASAKTPKLADDDVELDAVSLSDLDLFKLSFQPAPPKAATVRTPTYLPNPAALNRLSSLASDSENPSVHDTPSPSTVAASTPTSTHTRGQAKLELHNANLQLSLNIVPPSDMHSRRLPPLQSASASASDWAQLASAKAALVVSAGLQRQRTDALWQTRQPWMKNSADRFDFDLS